MSPKRKPMSGIGKGVDAFFDGNGQPEQATPNVPVDIQAEQHTDIQTSEPDENLARVTFYLRPSQEDEIEEIRLRLRRQGVKTGKSELARAALDFLFEQDISMISQRLNKSK